MTPEQAKTLKWFKWGELKHPELCDYAFFVFLDSVREEYGWPLQITSDARTPAENSVIDGSSSSSRHLAGQAVDVAFPPSVNHLWWLVGAVFKCQRSFPIELELVHGPGDTHVHIAWNTVGKASSLLLSLT